MFTPRKIFILALFCFVFGFCTSQSGPSCTTPLNQAGICINIKSCDVLITLLQSQSSNPQVRAYLRSSTCGFEGNTPMVCCPSAQLRTSPNPPPQPVVTEPIPSVRENPPTTTPRPEQLTNSKLLRPPNCGFNNVSSSRIVGGIPAKLGEFPWIVALGYKNTKNPNSPKWLCGGTLITDRHVLTAGHCVYNRRDLYLARVGELDLYSDDDGASPENILLVKATLHEQYSPYTYENDIAILTLEHAVNNPTVWPVCLPIDEPNRSKDFLGFAPIVAGWGNIYFNGPSSSFLQLTKVPVVSVETCKQAYGQQSIVDHRIICAGYARGGKDACKGDSGGPLMYVITEPKNLRYYQIGVVSYGFKCAEPGYPGVYTRVTDFLDWIEQHLE